MSFSWDEFHSDCRHVCNASIICEDGVIFTHKLILANMSGLMARPFLHCEKSLAHSELKCPSTLRIFGTVASIFAD